MIETKLVIPNFFLVGAPKCGTTSLSLYLEEHPEVFVSDPKEPHFFSNDINNGGIKDLSGYLDCFKGAHGGCRTIGDTSTLYLYSKTAIQNIIKFNPKSRFIVMLRNPLEIAFSFHQLALKKFGETETDFEKAWDLQLERKQGNQIPKWCPDPTLLLYGDIAMLGSQVERLLDRVERKKVYFIIFDNLIKDTKTEYKKVLNFLSIDSNHYPDFIIYNKTQRIKYPSLFKRLFQFIWLKNKLGINKSFGIGKILMKYNIVDSLPPSINGKMRNRLSGFYKKDIELLSELINKDFSKWLL
tara:strand:- start:503 stop:1396 length:894 start_codon:yes stop_codon:yes gene_type:complete